MCGGFGASPLGKIHFRKTHPTKQMVSHIFDFHCLSLICQLQEIERFASEMPVQIRTAEGLATWIHFSYLVKWVDIRKLMKVIVFVHLQDFDLYGCWEALV